MKKPSWWQIILGWFLFIVIILILPIFIPHSLRSNTYFTTIVQEIILLIYIWVFNHFVMHQKIFIRTQVPIKTQLAVTWLPVGFFLAAVIYSIMNLHNRSSVPIEILTVIFVGMAEELFFRGVILSSLIKKMQNRGYWGIITAVLISSLIFGLSHSLNILRQTVAATLVQISLTFILGLLLAAIYIRTGSILWPIIAHATNDAIGFVNNEQQAVTSHIVTISPLYILIFAYAIFLLRKSVVVDHDGRFKLSIKPFTDDNS